MIYGINFNGTPIPEGYRRRFKAKIAGRAYRALPGSVPNGTRTLRALGRRGNGSGFTQHHVDPSEQ